jgi:hypothetical protein
VRELVGYLRYDTAAELEKLNEIWELDRVFTNYLLPQQKLLEKRRHGAKVTKKHDAPATPHQRAICHPAMHHRHERRLKRIKPAALSRQILALTAQLETLSRAKQPAAVKTVNRAWNNWPSRRLFNEATKQPSGGFQMRQRNTFPGGIAMRQQGVPEVLISFGRIVRRGSVVRCGTRALRWNKGEPDVVRDLNDRCIS